MREAVQNVREDVEKLWPEVEWIPDPGLREDALRRCEGHRPPSNKSGPPLGTNSDYPRKWRQARVRSRNRAATLPNA